MIAGIKSRSSRGIGGGITTADRYVSQVAGCIGPEICNRNFLKAAGRDFSAVLKEAADIAAYAGTQWSIEKRVTRSEDMKASLPSGLELPAHAMMLIRNVLTTPKEDRDRDVLETAGAKPDSKMPLLWQHLHTLPIGKAIGVAEHTPEVLKMFTVLLDLNDLTNDACKLVEADALRFSHGFRALEFIERKASDDPRGEPIGFRITSFEIMEESLVSVASNTQAEIELWARGGLKSEVFKAHAKSMRDMTYRPQIQGFGAGIKTPKGTVNFGSLSDLKAALDSGLIKTNDPATAADQFPTKEQAEARAAEMGCAGAHEYADENSNPVWMPCATHREYLNAGSLGQTPDPAGTETTMAAAQSGQQKSDVADPMAGDVDLYENPVDAETRADAMGCIGTHEVGGKYRPCQSPEEYANQVIVNGKAANSHGKASGDCQCKKGREQFEALTKSLSGVSMAKRPASGAKYLDSSMLVGSFSWIYQGLHDEARKFLMMAGIDIDADEQVYIASLWADYGLICVCEWENGEPEERYFQASYAISGDSIAWTGTPAQVEVSTTVSIQAAGAGATSYSAGIKRLQRAVKTAKSAGDKAEAVLAVAKALEGISTEPSKDKAGRTLSAKNLATLKECHDDLMAIGAMDDVPRPAKALASQCHGRIKGMLDGVGAEEDSGKGTEPNKPAAVIDAKGAAAVLLMSDDIVLLKRTHNAISGILEAEKSYKKGSEYRNLLSRR